MKRIYVAEGAQANRESLLHDSRTGVHPDADVIARMNDVLSPCIMRGQSVRKIISNNNDVFGSIKERTIYDCIAGGLFDVKRGDLPEACSRRQRKKKETKTNAKCRVGRNYKMFLEYCRVNNITEWTELDTMIGRVGGKVLFTMILPGGIMLLFRRDRKSSQTCTRIFNMLWEIAGPELFRELFSVILTDNGTEFSDPDMIENWRPDPEHNPTKLLWHGIKLFYCDPYCASQKSHVERGNREERRILLPPRCLFRLANAGRHQPRCKPRRKLHARRPRRHDPIRRVRGEVRRTRPEVPRRSRHREDPSKRSNPQPHPPWR